MTLWFIEGMITFYNRLQRSEIPLVGLVRFRRAAHPEKLHFCRKGLLP